MLVYVDDILFVHDVPDSVLMKLDKYVLRKPYSVGESWLMSKKFFQEEFNDAIHSS